MRPVPELLSPAGTLDAARAALANGANAVYLGAERFNAREDGAQLTLDEPYRADVLHDGGVDAAIDAVAEVEQRVAQLRRLHEDVEGEVDAGAAGVGQEAGLLQLVHGELRPVVAGVESLGAEIHGVGPVGEGGPGGAEGARRGKQLWNWSVHGAQL